MHNFTTSTAATSQNFDKSFVDNLLDLMSNVKKWKIKYKQSSYYYELAHENGACLKIWFHLFISYKRDIRLILPLKLTTDQRDSTNYIKFTWVDRKKLRKKAKSLISDIEKLNYSQEKQKFYENASEFFNNN